MLACYYRRVSIRAILVCSLVLVSSNLWAGEAFYVGTWKIESAMVAPWWTERTAPDPAETKTLVGRSFSITAKTITGPPQVACKDPHYEVKEYPADMLFQGSFEEMHQRDKSVDPAKAAAAAGFVKGASWKTLETGCATEIDFHFIDPSTAAFGLNNYIYRLRKQR